MSTQTPLVPGKAASLVGKLSDTSTIEKAKAQPVSGAKTEPTMRALRRILGDDVLDIFPEGLTETVDDFYAVHSENEAKWDEVELDTQQERDDTLALMRAYAECAGEKGYTIRQDRTTAPSVLRFRVTDRRGSKSDGSGDASDS
jgi:hypothetical protein